MNECAMCMYDNMVYKYAKIEVVRVVHVSSYADICRTHVYNMFRAEPGKDWTATEGEEIRRMAVLH